MNKPAELIYNFIIDTDDMAILAVKIKKLTNLTGAVILDINNDHFMANNLAIIIELLSQKQLITIGIRSKKANIIKFAKFSNLVIFDKIKPIKTAAIDSYKPAIKPLRVIKNNILANEQIYIKNKDIVLLGDLDSHADIISDTNITIYGNSYGSIIAGVKDKNAMIFTYNFQAKLIAINGIYKKFNNIPVNILNKTLIITLNKEKLNFKVL